jgi:hypothetical protein
MNLTREQLEIWLNEIKSYGQSDGEWIPQPRAFRELCNMALRSIAARENEERYLFLKSRLTVPGAVHQFLRLNDWPPETDLSDIDAAIDAARTK